MATIRGSRSSIRSGPGDDPFSTDRYAILRQVKHELGAEARHYNFTNASSDARSIFAIACTRFRTRSMARSERRRCSPPGMLRSTSRKSKTSGLSEVVRDGRYLEATDRVLKQHGGLWFNRRNLCDFAPPFLGQIPKMKTALRHGSGQEY